MFNVSIDKATYSYKNVVTGIIVVSITPWKCSPITLLID